MEIAKKIISGIFKKNYEFGETDDSIFIPIIKSGIEKVGSPDKKNTLYNHALIEYVNIWLEYAKEEEDVDLEKEKKEAEKTFIKYWNDTT
jgi:hypothetical protein